jgi:hypothetical protein
LPGKKASFSGNPAHKTSTTRLILAQRIEQLCRQGLGPRAIGSSKEGGIFAKKQLKICCFGIFVIRPLSTAIMMRSSRAILFALFLAIIAMTSFTQAFDFKTTTLDIEHNSREVDLSDIIEDPLNEGQRGSSEQPEPARSKVRLH